MGYSSNAIPVGALATAARRTNLRSLTGIRAVAAALVFWHHGAGVTGDISSGMVGVSLFYILSGFLMAWTDRENDTATLFYRRRFARIYPAYAVAVIVALAYASVTRGISGEDFFAFTLLQSWVPNDAVYFAASAVFWSLSCEAFFYFTFPFIRRFTRALSDRGLWVIAAVAGAISLSVAVAGVGFPESPQLTWAVVVFPLSRLPEFIIGVCIGSLVARGWRSPVPMNVAWALCAAGVFAAAVVPYSLSRYSVTLVPFVIIVATLASVELSGARTLTSGRWMVKIGEWSYCFYLTHLTVIMFAVSAGTRVGLPAVAIIVFSLAGSVVAAWLLHRFVEKPANDKLRPKP